MSKERPILLVEDNPDDEALALHAFSKNRIGNQVIVGNQLAVNPRTKAPALHAISRLTPRRTAT